MPGDHASVPHHWWSTYVSRLSDFAEAYSATSGWGDYTIIRRTGEKIWEPMPLVQCPLFIVLSVVYTTGDAYVVCGKVSRGRYFLSNLLD
jgi:hypothetical protein